MARRNQSVTMENESTPQKKEPQEIVELKRQLAEARANHKRESVLTEARENLNKYESEYDHAKEVFFAVNSARRVLKNAGQL